MTPLKQLASVEEIAALALHLVADARATTGETIVVDGGLTELGTIQLHASR
jgi:enoyl-[acyl-carrier-protein] reductase (NADH)